MIVTNGLEISSRDYFGRREDLSFIVRFHWKTSNHLKEAIQLLLAARLDDCAGSETRSPRKCSDVLDAAEFEQIRFQVASNPSTPAAVLAYLAKHGSPRVLERVAENSQTLPETLALLAKSADASVRQAVAGNLNSPHEVLVDLAQDVNVDVRYGMAENSNLSEEILQLLVEDPNPYVGFRAATTLSRLHGGTVVESRFFGKTRSSQTHRQAISANG